MNNVSIQKLLGILSMWLLTGSAAFAQGLVSPYSSIGLGEIIHQGNIRTLGMGGAGMALPSISYSNTLNPALLTANFYTILDASYSGGYQQASSSNTISKSINGNLAGISLTFPVLANKYGMSVGMRPLTQVGYQLSSLERIASTGSFANYQYEGSGGISQVYWSHGVRLFKGFNVGMEMNYNFGSITNESISLISDPFTTYITDLQEQTTFSDVTFTPALAYNVAIDSAVYVGVGLKYDRTIDFDVDFTRLFLRKAASGAIISADTVRQASGQITIPQQITAGVSIYRPFHYAVGVDISLSNWSEYNNQVRSSTLTDAFRLSVGGEFTPDANSISNYLKRVTYRAGLRYERTPWVVNDVQINDIGITFGLSMPISRGLSMLNWAFAVGQRGDLESGQIQERYFRLGIGLSINDPQWFRRRKIN